MSNLNKRFKERILELEKSLKRSSEALNKIFDEDFSTEYRTAEMNEECIPYAWKIDHISCSCYHWPYRWPCWVGGNRSFINDEGQDFNKLKDLRINTMLEI